MLSLPYGEVHTESTFHYKEHSRMRFANVKRKLLWRSVAMALPVALTVTAFAQDSPRLRTPRRLVPGPIQQTFRPERITTNTSGTFNTDQGPGAGPIGPGPGCDVFPAPANIGTAVGLSTSDRRLRR